MKKQINRRDFLKLAGMLPLGVAAPSMLKMLQPGQAKNVLIIVFDAWSAYNVSLYGYERNTTPTINRLAQRAIRYHNHHSGGSFTTTGTASLLTGVLPWTHRAFNLNGTVSQPFETKNYFFVFRDYYGVSYTHNPWAFTILKQFKNSIDELIAREKLVVGSVDNLVTQIFKNDDDISSVSWARTMKINQERHAYSLLASSLYEDLQKKEIEDLQKYFPRGLPTSGTDNGFTLEQARDYIVNRLISIPQPFAGYFHFLPPHFPYRTSSEFYNAFSNDGYKALEKPLDVFMRKTGGNGQNLPLKRKYYDEFVLYCDDEFGKLYNALENSGLLENTWLVLTSDHGELFERGINGHNTEALYQPVLRVPLMIFEPGRAEGMDVYDYTSAIDILPTLAHVTGQPIPEWSEGVLLPPYAPSAQIPDRSLYTLWAVQNEQFKPFTIGSFVQIRGGYKLHYYTGYRQTRGEELVRLYDLSADPEEMNDLASLKPETTAELLHELKAKLKQVDEPYL